MTPQEELKELTGLVKTIDLYRDKILSKEARAKITELAGRLEFRLADLKEQYQKKEVETKLKILRDVVKIWKE